MTVIMDTSPQILNEPVSKQILHTPENTVSCIRCKPTYHVNISRILLNESLASKYNKETRVFILPKTPLCFSYTTVDHNQVDGLENPHK